MTGETTRRTVRIEDALWQAAQEQAAERGDNLSAVIRQALANYISEGTINEHQ